MMTLRLNVLGFEVAKLHLDFGDLFDSPGHVTPVDRWAKGTSHWFFRRMTK
jgi:hypothetical protein